MQFAWLEKLASDGHVSTAAREEIYRDCSEILKHASLGGTLGDKVFGAIGTGLGLTFPLMLGGFLSSRANKAEITQTVQALTKTKAEILSLPEFVGKRQKAEARFNEVAKIAPTVAGNKALMVKILHEKLDSGLTAQDAQNLAMIQATHTPNARLQNAMQKRASDEKAGETLADMVMICKEAGIRGSTMGQALANLLAMSAVSVAGGVGVGATKAYLAKRDRARLEEKLRQSFDQALRLSNPDREPLHANKEKARQAFQTLAHFAPNVAMQPDAARSFMNRMVAYDQTGQNIQSTDLKDLTEIERNIRASKSPSPFFEGLAQGSKALGLESAVKGTVTSFSDPFHHDLERNIAEDLGYRTTGKNPEYKP